MVLDMLLNFLIIQLLSITTLIITNKNYEKIWGKMGMLGPLLADQELAVKKYSNELSTYQWLTHQSSLKKKLKCTQIKSFPFYTYQKKGST